MDLQSTAGPEKLLCTWLFPIIFKLTISSWHVLQEALEKFKIDHPDVDIVNKKTILNKEERQLKDKWDEFWSLQKKTFSVTRRLNLVISRQDWRQTG